MDKLTPRARSINMGKIRSRDTSPEMLVRKIAHHLGYRYRIHRKDLPGKPDLTFPRLKKVIFVHGCFWHQHTNVNCKIVRIPKSRQDYWLPKLRRNVERDLQHQELLQELGWTTLTIWECELSSLEELAARIDGFLSS